MRIVTSFGLAGVLLLGLAVAGCQPTSSKPTASAAAPAPSANATNTPSSTQQNGKWQSTGVFDDRLEAATHKMMSNALETCMSAGAGLMDCVAGELAQAIDPSGNAKSHCAGQPDADAQFQCALAGTVVMKVRANNGVEMSDSAWSGYDKAMREELLAVGIHESFACAKVHGPKGPAFRECMSAAVLAKMDVQPEIAEPCLTLEPEEKFGQCVGEAGMISLLEAAAGRST
jgi:hypothetical protein